MQHNIIKKKFNENDIKKGNKIFRKKILARQNASLCVHENFLDIFYIYYYDIKSQMRINWIDYQNSLFFTTMRRDEWTITTITIIKHNASFLYNIIIIIVS